MTDADDIPTGGPEGDEVLAAEFALRLLDGAEAEAAQRRVLTDRDFADRVARWNSEFADLAEEVSPVAPSATTRRALLDRMFGDRAPARAGRGAGLWRALGLVSTAVAAALAVALFTGAGGPGRLGVNGAPVYISEVTSADGTYRYLAFIDASADTVRILRTAGGATDGRSLQLWGVAPGAAPVSLGVLPVDARAAVPVPEGLRAQAEGLVLAVSDEPEGGSPTGQPTGTVVASGEAIGL